MSLHHHHMLHKRESYLPFSGSVVVSNPNPTVSSLAQNTDAVAIPSVTQVGIPLVTATAPGSSTSTTQASTPISTTNSSTSSSGQISLGTVIGACVAALIALILAVLLALYCSRRQKRSPHSTSRNAANNIARRRSHLGPWKRMNDNTDRWVGQEGQEQAMSQRPASGSLGAMFHRTISNTSGEKSSDSHNRESVGTMRHFAKYHPDLAVEMASQGATTGVDAEITKPPPVLHLMGRSEDANLPVSWDGETVGGGSFMSLHSSFASSASPAMMATAKSTPPATTSSFHRWESAEVVHVGRNVSEDGEIQNPFEDGANSIRSKRSSTKGRNPFFSGRDHPVRRTLLPDIPKNPFTDPSPPGDSSAAIQSLIAALEDPTGYGASDRVISFQSSLYSGMTVDDGDSAISVTAFPHPPTQVNVR